MKKIFLLAFAVLLAVFPAACAWFASAPEPPRTPDAPANPVAALAQRRIQENRSFVYAFVPGSGKSIFRDPDGVLSGIEPEIVAALARELDLKVEYLQTSPELLPVLIRSGRADLASCGCSSEQIRGLYLEPVLPYSLGRLPGDPAFLIRPGDDSWKARLQAAFERIPREDILRKHLVAVEAAHVTLVDPSQSANSVVPVEAAVPPPPAKSPAPEKKSPAH